MIYRKNLEQVTTPKGRYYSVEGKRYPSVTTVLKYYTDKEEGLQKWRDRIGHDKANQIASRAANIGLITHDLVSNKLTKNEEPQTDDPDISIIMEHYHRIMNCLGENLVETIGSEFKIVNEEVGVAGTCDLLGKWKYADGSVRKAIIDFKTKRNEMYMPALEEYGLQCTIYAGAIPEINKPKDIIILESAEGMENTRSFVSNTDRFNEILETDLFRDAVKKATDDCYGW